MTHMYPGYKAKTLDLDNTSTTQSAIGWSREQLACSWLLQTRTPQHLKRNLTVDITYKVLSDYLGHCHLDISLIPSISI